MDSAEVKLALSKAKLNPDESDSEAKGLLCLKDDHAFIWDQKNSVLLVVALSRNILKEDSKLQILRPTNSPVFNVEKILACPDGRWICLYGRKGVSVIELPRKSGKFGRFQNGQREIVCRSVPVGQDIVSYQSRTIVQEVKFHPPNNAQTQDTVVVLLSSDNKIRFFSLDLDIDMPVLIKSLHLSNDSKTIEESLDDSNTFTNKVFMGETAVSLAFAPPVGDETLDDIQSSLWPIFVLYDNGDVYCVLTSLKESFKSSKMIGPLTMHPEAPDNYECDSCSLLCLHPTISSPPLLVIANNSGVLYHCLVLNNNIEEEENLDCKSDWSVSTFRTTDNDPKLGLFVFEAIELGLGILDDDDNRDLERSRERQFDHPIILDVDPNTPARYFCSHKAGVHCVALPIMTQLAEFARKSDGQQELDYAEVMEQESIVEHLVCTQMSSDFRPAPVLGLALEFPPATLYCLLSDCKVEKMEISDLYFQMPPLPTGTGGDTGKQSLPLKHNSYESFEQKIRAMLKKNSTLPKIKTSEGSDVSSKECLDIITRSTQILKDEYIGRLENVRNELEKRATHLRSLKTHQAKAFNKFAGEKHNLREKAAELSERYEDLRDNGEKQQRRVESVLQKIQNKLPGLSDAEMKMLRQLRDFDRRSKDLANGMEQIRIKSRYQVQQIDLAKNSSMQQQKTKSLDGDMGDNQLNSIKEVLKKDSKDISDLVKTINVAKKELISSF